MKTIKCDICGRFISYFDLEQGFATHKMTSPDGDVSYEEFESLCRNHYNPKRTTNLMDPSFVSAVAKGLKNDY